VTTLLFVGMLVFTVIATINISAAFRVYFRAGLTSRLWLVASQTVVLISIWIGYILFTIDLCDNYGLCSTPGEENIIYVIVGVVFFVGVYFHVTYLGISLNKDSDLLKEIFEKTSYWQRVTGDIPIYKVEKRLPPFLRKKKGIIIGVFLMIVGSLLSIFLIIMPNLFHFVLSFLIVSLSAFIMGLLLIIFSVAYLGKERDT
jgi:hypothetical protein